MSNPVCYLGVDVAKNSLEVAFERHRWKFSNSKEGHLKFIAQIQKLPTSMHVVCESTGCYHIEMCLALQEAGLAVTIANPARIRYFGRSEGTLAKNDPIDAKLIERFANSKRPRLTRHCAASALRSAKWRLIAATLWRWSKSCAPIASKLVSQLW